MWVLSFLVGGIFNEASEKENVSNNMKRSELNLTIGGKVKKMNVCISTPVSIRGVKLQYMDS